MKERPIPFSTELIPKILDGTKTQTRRTKGLQFINENPSAWHIGKMEVAGKVWWEASRDWTSSKRLDCPYGQVGDRLWVRESFCHACASICFRAGFEPTGCLGPEWKSGRFLFKKDARLWLEITNLRVERLQEITEEDALAEGIELTSVYVTSLADTQAKASFEGATSYKVAFRIIWDSLNAKRGYSWESNPWVWVVEFKLIPHKGCSV